MDAMKKRLVCKECGEREPRVLWSVDDECEVWVACCRSCGHSACVKVIADGVELVDPPQIVPKVSEPHPTRWLKIRQTNLGGE